MSYSFIVVCQLYPNCTSNIIVKNQNSLSYENVKKSNSENANTVNRIDT